MESCCHPANRDFPFIGSGSNLVHVASLDCVGQQFLSVPPRRCSGKTDLDSHEYGNTDAAGNRHIDTHPNEYANAVADGNTNTNQYTLAIKHTGSSTSGKLSTRSTQW